MLTTVFVMLLVRDSFFYRWRNCAVFHMSDMGLRKYPDETEVTLWRNYSVSNFSTQKLNFFYVLHERGGFEYGYVQIAFRP